MNEELQEMVRSIVRQELADAFSHLIAGDPLREAIQRIVQDALAAHRKSRGWYPVQETKKA